MCLCAVSLPPQSPASGCTLPQKRMHDPEPNNDTALRAAHDRARREYLLYHALWTAMQRTEGVAGGAATAQATARQLLRPGNARDGGPLSPPPPPATRVDPAAVASWRNAVAADLAAQVTQAAEFWYPDPPPGPAPPADAEGCCAARGRQLLQDVRCAQERAQGLAEDIDALQKRRVAGHTALLEQRQECVRARVKAYRKQLGKLLRVDTTALTHCVTQQQATTRKLRALEAELLTATYTKATVPALREIKAQLDNTRRALGQREREAEQLLRQYDMAGAPLRQTLDEYCSVRQQLQKKYWMVKQMTHPEVTHMSP